MPRGRTTLKTQTFHCELLKNSPDMSPDPLLMLCEVLKKRKEKKIISTLNVVFRSGWFGLLFNSNTVEGLLSPPSGQEKIFISMEIENGRRERKPNTQKKWEPLWIVEYLCRCCAQCSHALPTPTAGRHRSSFPSSPSYWSKEDLSHVAQLRALTKLMSFECGTARILTQVCDSKASVLCGYICF